MPSRFHPIEDGLWDDPKFDACGDLAEATGDERGFFAFLCSNKFQRPAGIYRATDGELAESYRWPMKRVTISLHSLSARGLIVRDGSWLFLPGYLKRQALNPGMRKAVSKIIQSCTSYKVLSAFVQRYPLFKEQLPNGWPTVPEPSSEIAPTEEHQSRAEEHQSTTTTVSSPAPPSGWPSVAALVELYNTLTPDNVPSVEVIRGQRLAKITRYLRLFPEEAFWREVFAQYQRSRFLSGKTPARDGHEGFKPDFDWLLSKNRDGTDNCVKVHDGRYADG